jgi:murein DD-endopeptidase MepM/ murein hydrolase activator NlpD
MTRRPTVFALLAVAVACSQRAPWRVVDSSPMTAPSGAPASRYPRPTGAMVASASTPTVSAPAATPAPAKSKGIALSMVAAAPPAEMDATAVAHLKGMLFPVGGFDSTRLDDSFNSPRDGGTRKHNAIDIMAPRGTPVLAVADGRVIKLMKSSKGGLTLYAADLEDQFVYYYAHLDHYNPKLYSGKPLMRGDTLGYVGTTGNAPSNMPHLHFQVMRMGANGDFVNGTPINPYPLLHATTTAEK